MRAGHGIGYGGGDRKVVGRKGGVTWLHKVEVGPTCAAASLVEVGVDSFSGNQAEASWWWWWW